MQAKYFAYVGRKDVKKACIYVKDLVQAIYELSNDYKLEYDIFNVSYNPSRSISELVSIISDLGEMKFPRLVILGFSFLFCSNIFYFTIFNKKDFNPSRMNKLVVSNIDSTKINQIIKFKFGLAEQYLIGCPKTEFKQKENILNEKALITGITGQDGSYLAEFLLKRIYSTWNKRRSSLFNTR